MINPRNSYEDNWLSSKRNVLCFDARWKGCARDTSKLDAVNSLTVINRHHRTYREEDGFRQKAPA